MTITNKAIIAGLLPLFEKLDIPAEEGKADFDTSKHPLALFIKTEYHRFYIIPESNRQVCWIGGINPQDPYTMSHPADGPPKDVEISLAEPTFFSLVTDEVVHRWRFIQYLSDKKLLSYVESHSKALRAIFHREHIDRLVELAGDPIEIVVCREWDTYTYIEIAPTIDRARDSLEWTGTKR